MERVGLIVALLELAHDFVTSLFDTVDFSLLALNVSLDLSHLIVQLVQRRLNLLSLLAKLFSLLAYFHVDPLEIGFFLSSQLLLVDKLCFYLWIFSFDLVALFRDFELLPLVLFNLPIGLRDFRDFGLLFVVDHDVVLLKQIKVLFELLLALVALVYLRV